jgi:hypothetical protein
MYIVGGEWSVSSSGRFIPWRKSLKFPLDKGLDLLRRIFGPKKDEVTGDWRKLHNEELHDLYSSPSIITIIKVKRMRWTVHVARIGHKWNAFRLLVGSQREGDR